MEYMAENKTNDLTLGFNMAGYWHKESRVQKLDVSLKESVANVCIRQLSLKEQYLKKLFNHLLTFCDQHKSTSLILCQRPAQGTCIA